MLGLAVAVTGLVGFWGTRDVERTELGAQQRELLGIEEGEFHASFVVAGRDILYGEGESAPIYGQDGSIVGWDFRGATSAQGVNTDTIVYVNVIDTAVTMVAIPRDLFVGEGTRKINGVFAREGAEGLERRLEQVLGLPIDYYAIINIDIFQDLVDALGGVEVNVPERMYYRDRAAGLTIDLQAGPQVLDGEQASDFVRYRQFRRGDIDRLDNVKRLAYAMLSRLQQLHVRAVGRLPELASTFFEQVETSASPALVRRMLPRVGELEIRAATLPTVDAVRGETQGLEVDPVEVERFLAGTFGGVARAFEHAPEVTLLISNRSGRDGLEERYRQRLQGLGVPAERIVTREGSLEPGGTRVLATSSAWGDADYYTTLLGTGKQQVDHLDRFEGEEVELELVLGADAVALSDVDAMAASVPEPEPAP